MIRFLHYDANHTNGQDPEKVSAIFLKDGEQVSCKQSDHVILTLDKYSILSNGTDTAILLVSKPFSQGGTVTLEIDHSGEKSTQQVVLSTNPLPIEIVSTTIGKITFGISEPYAEETVLEVK